MVEKIEINIQMQIGEDYHFDKRAIYYRAKLVTDQLGEGMIDDKMNKTISINILDDDLVPETTEVHSCYKIINTVTGKVHPKFSVLQFA